MSAITERILARLGDMELVDKLLALPNADRNSLLLKLFQAQAERATPNGLLKATRTNRFCVPSGLDPVDYHAFEAELLSLARQNGMQGILLSPCAPFASASAFGCVDQNNVVSAVRGTEILGDPTNMLVLLMAERLRAGRAQNCPPLHCCTTARVLRAQPFPARKGYYSHFGIFCIASSGRDSGSYACEKELLAKHLTYYMGMLRERFGAKVSIVLRKRSGYADGDGFMNAMAGLARSEFPDVPLTFDLTGESNLYYRGVSFTVSMEKDGGAVTVGDGGFVDWTQRMLGSKKERCLISGIGMDRLLID